MSKTADRHLKFISEMMYANLLSAIMMGPDAMKTALEKTVEGIVDVVGDLERRRCEALALAVKYGSIDGEKHKAWVIDQMVRELTGCPMVTREAIDCNGKPYTYEALGESDEYRKLVEDARAGEDGPETYDWDEGIAP